MSLQYVSLELHSIQKYLFEIPKMRAMVAANRSITKFFRKLAEIWPGEDVSSHGFSSKEVIDELTLLIGMEGKLLEQESPENKICADISKGIFSQSGGHFEGILPEAKTADFIQKVYQHAMEIVPGLRFSISSHAIDPSRTLHAVDSALRKAITREKFDPEGAAGIPTGFPFSETCHFTRGETAESRWPTPDGIGYPVGKRAYGLLNDHVHPDEPDGDIVRHIENAILYKQNMRLPEDFEEFFPKGADKRYLAVIHADGNGMGIKFSNYREGYKGSTFRDAALRVELFFARNRVLNRIALADAIKTILLPRYEKKGILPVRILMSGGDDLCMVLRAGDVFDFLIEYARRHTSLLGTETHKSKDEYASYHELTEKWCKEMGSMSFRAGVAIVPFRYPFHAAYDLAEELSGQARHISSAVDWHIMSNASNESVQNIRQKSYSRHYQIAPDKNERLQLTRRGNEKYPILGNDGLEQLLELASLLDIDDSGGHRKIARSQLKSLYAAFARGRYESELAVRELIQFLKRKRIDCQELPPAWEHENGTDQWSTQWLDLIEMSDILKTRKEMEDPKPACPAGGSEDTVEGGAK